MQNCITSKNNNNNNNNNKKIVMQRCKLIFFYFPFSYKLTPSNPIRLFVVTKSLWLSNIA